MLILLKSTWSLLKVWYFLKTSMASWKLGSLHTYMFFLNLCIWICLWITWLPSQWCQNGTGNHPWQVPWHGLLFVSKSDIGLYDLDLFKVMYYVIYHGKPSFFGWYVCHFLQASNRQILDKKRTPIRPILDSSGKTFFEKLDRTRRFGGHCREDSGDRIYAAAFDEGLGRFVFEVRDLALKIYKMGPLPVISRAISPL